MPYKKPHAHIFRETLKKFMKQILVPSKHVFQNIILKESTVDWRG
jgi:hypothetical protein